MSTAKSLLEVDIIDAAIKRMYLMNWHISPEQFDELPHRYPAIWGRLNYEEYKKREVENGQKNL